MLYTLNRSGLPRSLYEYQVKRIYRFVKTYILRKRYINQLQYPVYPEEMEEWFFQSSNQVSKSKIWTKLPYPQDFFFFFFFFLWAYQSLLLDNGILFCKNKELEWVWWSQGYECECKWKKKPSRQTINNLVLPLFHNVMKICFNLLMNKSLNCNPHQICTNI